MGDNKNDINERMRTFVVIIILIVGAYLSTVSSIYIMENRLALNLFQDERGRELIFAGGVGIVAYFIYRQLKKKLS